MSAEAAEAAGPLRRPPRAAPRPLRGPRLLLWLAPRPRCRPAAELTSVGSAVPAMQFSSASAARWILACCSASPRLQL
eukprot:11196841-Lingulodinium_polyedra.AAC.1